HDPGLEHEPEPAADLLEQRDPFGQRRIKIYRDVFAGKLQRVPPREADVDAAVDSLQRGLTGVRNVVVAADRDRVREARACEVEGELLRRLEGHQAASSMESTNSS